MPNRAATRTPQPVPARPLFGFWRERRVSLAISLAVTFAALFIYQDAFLGDSPAPAFGFLQRIELATLDARFRARGRLPADSRIVIVEIDQRSQQELGRWPFPRSHFATLLDILREDGARVAAFDIVFSQPDHATQPLRELRESLAGINPNRQVAARLAELEAKYDHDERFAVAIERFGRVVLGQFFLFTPAEIHGVSPATQDESAERIWDSAFDQVVATHSEQGHGQADYRNLVQFYRDAQLPPVGAQANTPRLTDAVRGPQSSSGFFNTVTEADGAVRRTVFALPYGRHADDADWDFYPSLDVETARTFLGAAAEETALYFGETGIDRIELGSRLTLRPDEIGRQWINFRGPERTFEYVSLADVVHRRVLAGKFRDKIVLVGASATGIGDLVTTPFGSLTFPGVEVHANVLDNILNQRFLERGPQQMAIDVALILFFGLPLGIWLAWVAPKWMPVALLLAGPLVAGMLYAFQHGWWLNFTGPAVLTLLPNVILVALYRVLVEEREKRRVSGAFRQYVSPEVIRRVLRNPALVEPRKSALTVLFSDIRAFTEIAETMDPQQLAAQLNEYFTEMTAAVFRHQGTLDKYIGDALMAFWNAPFDMPAHATACCRAALEMSERLDALHRKWRAAGRPAFEMGIGVNTGAASVGNMGSALRYGYTALGDAVNLASRVEGLNRVYGTRLLVTQHTVSACAASANENGAGEFLFRELDLIRVKGKQQPVAVFELMGYRGAAGRQSELAGRFADARTLYSQRKWESAAAAFEQLDATFADRASRVLAQHCRRYLAHEPASDWDGVFTMETK
ncbi:MAG: CHASE2 domain-containing protein [Candidatus Acidiferrales bacterium]